MTVKDKIGLRIDSYLAEELNLSRSKVQKLIKEKLVLVNGKEVSSSYNVKLDDEIEVNDIDYKKTPKKELSELIKGLKIVFIGLNEHYESYHRISARKDITIIPAGKNNFDQRIISNADFLFIYKNCISHSDVFHAFSGSVPPYCLLSEPTNQEMLENAMANVLYRFLYGE